MMPVKSIKRYVPKIFGFKVHAAAALARWQDAHREEMQERLKEVNMDKCFKEDEEDGEEEEMEDDEDDGEVGDGL